MDNQVNLYAELTKVERHHLPVPMPFKTKDGQEIVLPMVSLSGRENYEVKQKAEADTRLSYGKDIPKKEEVSDYEERWKDNMIWHTLQYAVRLPHDLKVKFFVDKNALLDFVTPDQAGIMFSNYTLVQYTQPWLVHLDNDDPEKIEALIEKLIEDGTNPHFFLNSISSVSQSILINSLAARLRKLMQDTGSLGMLQENGVIAE